MYNKHTCSITMYGVVVDNRVSVEFNTEKKRNDFLAKVKNRTITSISNISYPWNPDDGKHNLMSLKEFSEFINIPLYRVERAVKNGYLQIEYIDGIPHVVNANNQFRIKGITYDIREPIEKKGKEIMPISRNGKAYYTDEQYDIARNNSSALEYDRSQGYDLIPKGKDFTLREHTSMVFTERGGWFWNSQNIKGGAIEFLTHYEHKTMVEAVLTLAGENIHTQESAPKYERRPEAQPPPEKKPFMLPERNDNHKRAFAYLTKTRLIDPDIISQCMKENKIYESMDKHNAVFVFQDNNGEAKGAFLRGTNTDPKYQFKGMAAGSDRASSYFLFGGGKNATVACVFEASIDALSCATLHKRAGNFDLNGRYYVATGGAGDSNFMEFLKGHPEVKSVILCQDNDAAGNKFAKDLGDKLRGMGYQVSRCLSKGKDFNEELKNEKSLEEPVQQNPPPVMNEAQTENQRFAVVPNSNGYAIQDTVSGCLIKGDYGTPAHYLNKTDALDMSNKLNDFGGYIDSRQVERFVGAINFEYRAVYVGNSQNDIYGDWQESKEEAEGDLHDLQQEHHATDEIDPHFYEAMAKEQHSFYKDLLSEGDTAGHILNIPNQTIEAVKSEVEAARKAANPNHVSMQEFGAAIEAWAEDTLAEMGMGY